MKYEYFPRDTVYCVAVLNSRVAKTFEWYRTLREMKVSVLHIVDETFSWYHNCIDDVRPLLDKYKPARIVGASMGGYAALLFGGLHGIHAKAFGPQTTLACNWDTRWAPEWQKIRETTKYPDYLDVEPYAGKADIYYCNYVPLDKRHAKRLNNKCRMIQRDC